MALYLSEIKRKSTTIIDTAVIAGTVQIDSFPSVSYRTVKYHLVVEDSVTASIFNLRFTVTHDGLGAIVTQFDDLSGGDIDIDIDADYDGTADNVLVSGTFPNNCKVSIERQVFINREPSLRKDGSYGPSEGLYPSNFLYPA